MTYLFSRCLCIYCTHR